MRLQRSMLELPFCLRSTAGKITIGVIASSYSLNCSTIPVTSSWFSMVVTLAESSRRNDTRPALFPRPRSRP